ncbi:fluoride efflux transporter CrcB [Streptomyces sp. NPDC052013]|uniref:fluoride efflux transporter CrcB n=1 Tax=Streptomyces sp. NPDC052013 TaxID=3365679 RepID=UPI0037D54059
MTAPPTAPRRTRPARRAQAPVVAAVAAGGGAGAAARYAAALWWPSEATGFPWTTLWVNITGCAVIGVFMVLVTEVRAAHPLLRPFFGTGVLGGFTTFSTYAVDVQRLLDAGQVRPAVLYLAATPLAALAAVASAAAATGRALGRAVGRSTS